MKLAIRSIRVKTSKNNYRGNRHFLNILFNNLQSEFSLIFINIIYYFLLSYLKSRVSKCTCLANFGVLASCWIWHACHM